MSLNAVKTLADYGDAAGKLSVLVEMAVCRRQSIAAYGILGIGYCLKES